MFYYCYTTNSVKCTTVFHTKRVEKFKEFVTVRDVTPNHISLSKMAAKNSSRAGKSGACRYAHF